MVTYEKEKRKELISRAYKLKQDLEELNDLSLSYFTIEDLPILMKIFDTFFMSHSILPEKDIEKMEKKIVRIKNILR